MRVTSCIIIAVALIAFAITTNALAGAVEAPPEETQPQQGEQTTEKPSAIHEEIEVWCEQPALEAEALDLELLDSGRAANLGIALGSLTGVSGVRRSENSYEPVIHGLGWERVQTQVNGMPLYGACPARMDPPTFVLSASAAREVSVVKGLASVSLGPGGTGGRVDVSTDYDRGADPGRELDSWIRAAYDGANDGFKGSAGLRGGTQAVDFAVGLELLDQGDYTSADGTTVPASQKDSGGFISFGHRPTPAQRWSVGAIYQKGEEIAYPSLPMDTDDAETAIYSAAYRYQPKSGAGSLSSIEISLGASNLDHRMSNRQRTNRMMMQAETSSEASTYSAGLTTSWIVGTRSVIKGGFDLNTLGRDALRQRYVVAADRTFFDHLWPDVAQDDLGIFAEYALAPGVGWQLRFGLRYDDVHSEAAAADDPALGGGTIREAWVRFYGPDAAVADRDEGLVTGNVIFTRELGADVKLQGGVGLASRAAGVTERYFAFALSPSGFLVGNPTLDAEKKREVTLGATIQKAKWSGALSGYHYSFRDYILPVVLIEIDVDGDGSLDLVRGFENTDATLTGIDLSVVYRPSARWTVPASLFYVRGEDDQRNLPLPEIPPLELRLAGRWSLPDRHPGWLELGARFVAEQERVDPAFPENATPGFTVWHLRGRFDVARYLTIEAGVENLLDREYQEHLTREAAGNVPGLSPGQEIPQPGRFFTLVARFSF